MGGLTWREGESVIAKLAKLFFGISEPLEETFLLDEFDGSGADAGVKQRSVRGALTPANPANV